jgi:hypothetical protein
MKVYDCFTFFNELDLLEIRLNELNDVVDYFVLVESTRSFQNKPKECHYLNNKHRFKNFNHKIIRLEIPEQNFTTNAWSNEALSWNYCINGLTDAKENDVIMISALDEIPKQETILNIIKENILPSCVLTDLYYFYLNTKYKWDPHYGTKWPGTYLTYYSQLDKNNIYNFINLRKQTKQIYGGWHFSFLGDAINAYNKVNNYSHSEKNHLSIDFYKSNIENLKDIFGRSDTIFDSLCELETLPTFVFKNIENYRKYIK